MRKGLKQLVEKKGEYDKESQDFIESLILVENEVSSINSMKRSEGWNILDKKLQMKTLKLLNHQRKKLTKNLLKWLVWQEVMTIEWNGKQKIPMCCAWFDL